MTKVDHRPRSERRKPAKINPLGPFVIRERERIRASPKAGLRQQWTEFQVVQGRTVVSRHDTYRQAEKARAEFIQ